jgi:hypothetical protein
VVRPERFELPTCCSGGNRSIQLSYGRARIDTVYMGRGTGFNGGRFIRPAAATIRNHASETNWVKTSEAKPAKLRLADSRGGCPHIRQALRRNERSTLAWHGALA